LKVLDPKIIGLTIIFQFPVYALNNLYLCARVLCTSNRASLCVNTVGVAFHASLCVAICAAVCVAICVAIGARIRIRTFFGAAPCDSLLVRLNGHGSAVTLLVGSLLGIKVLLSGQKQGS
jgi:hypothetical protein